MRSVFFQNPLEYQIQTDREEWNQGDSVQGRLRVRNMSGNSVPSIQSSVLLAYGVRKEIKSGDAEAWKIQSEIMPISGANLFVDEPLSCPLVLLYSNSMLVYPG